MCSNYPGIKLEPALGTLEDKIEHLSSYAHVVHTTAKQVISRRRKNENVFKMSKDEKCTCKACKNTVFHCQLCKFVGFLLPSSSCLLKLPTVPVPEDLCSKLVYLWLQTGGTATKVQYGGRWISLSFNLQNYFEFILRCTVVRGAPIRHNKKVDHEIFIRTSDLSL